MAEAIRLGRMTDTMEEGFIAEINIKAGDKVKTGDSLAEIETDKATLPLESYYNGTILYVAAKKGDTLKIGELVAIIGKEGEDYQSILNEKPTGAGAQATTGAEQNNTSTPAKETQVPATQTNKPKEETRAPSTQTTETKEEIPGDTRIKASPLARSIAKEKGISLSGVQGSGEEGRIIKRDLDRQGELQPAFVGKEEFTEVRVSQMRKTIAKRLSESKANSPHFYLTVSVNMTACVSLRSQLNEVLPEKISLNDLVIKSVALAIREFSAVNCSWQGDTIRYNKHIHIGMAVAVDEGLLVPVIRFADGKTVQQISAEAKALAQKAVDKKLQPAEMQGSTFSVSNLGMFGIEEFTAIINPPDACILAIGVVKQESAVIEGEIKIAHQMKLTLSCDHRAVDGATGAKFLQVLKKVLEQPVRLLL